jgi:dihydroorotate dehydrogenase electron transfer subunit
MRMEVESMKPWFNARRVEQVDRVSDDAVMLTFDREPCTPPAPGQFYMMWLPGVGENPYSASGERSFTIRDLGSKDERPDGVSFSHAACQLKKGDYVNMRGPLGRGFFIDHDPETSHYIIAGGCGIAPMRYLAERLRRGDSGGRRRIRAAIGAKTAGQLMFEGYIDRHVDELVVCTDDGSRGKAGFVTGAIDDLELYGKSMFYVCGPEVMMDATAKALVERGFRPGQIQLLLERYMRCGVGVCGSCACGGKRVCTEGPAFTYQQILDDAGMAEDFGRRKKDLTGARVPV